MKLQIVSLLFALLFSHSLACSCIRTNLTETYYSPSVSHVFRATVIGVYNSCHPCKTPNPFGRRYFALKVVKTFKGCGTNDILFLSSPVSSATCGVNLLPGVDYLLPLRKVPYDNINLCQFIKPWSSVTAAEHKFLNTREICCPSFSDGTKCSCVNGSPPVNCLVRPCSVSKPPCPKATQCKDNYCGGCFAEWFDSKSQPAFC